MKTLLALALVGVALLVSAAQAQIARVPGQAYLEQRPYQPLQPSTVPPPVVHQAPQPHQYRPRQQTCFTTVSPTAAGAVARTTCY